MVAAVIDLDAEVHHLATGQEAAGGRFLDALVDGGDVLARDHAAHDGVFEDIAGTAGQAFHLDPAVAELATAAGLLLVAALHLHLAAHGLTVGHLGRLEDDVHLEAAFGLFHRKFDVQLAHAGQQDIAVFFVAGQTQGDVFVQQALDGGVDLVFIALFLGSQGVGDELRRQFGHGQGEGLLFVAEAVAGAGVLQLGHGHDGARAHRFLAGGLGLAGQEKQAAQPFAFAAAHVLESGVTGDGAGEDAHQGKLAGEGVGQGLEDETGHGAFGIGQAFLALGIHEGGALGGGGQQGLDGVQHGHAALVFQRGADQHRTELAGQHALAQADLQVFQRQAAFFQVLFHELFIAFGDVFHGQVAQQAHVVAQIGGHVAFADGAVFAKGIGFAGQHVHITGKGLALTDGHLQGHGLDAQGGQAVKSHLEVGAVAVHLVDDEDGGQVLGVGEVPEFFGQGAHAVHGVQHEDHAVHALEQAFHIAGKVAVTRDVKHEMAVLVPEAGSHRGLDGAATTYFFRFIVEAGGAVFNGAHAGQRAAIEEEHLGQRRFAAAAGAYKCVSTLGIHGVGHAKTPLVSDMAGPGPPDLRR